MQYYVTFEYLTENGGWVLLVGDSFGGKFDSAKTLEDFMKLRGLNKHNSRNFIVEEF